MSKPFPRVLLLALLLVVGYAHVYAQQQKPPLTKLTKDSAATVPVETDIMDILKRLKKRSPGDSANTVKKIHSGQLLFSVVPAAGYTLTSGLVGSINVNMAFYTSDPKRTNISSITTNFIYTQRKQITIPLQANIWTRGNNFNFIVDWRYFKYPQDTYGLGPDTRLTDAVLLDNSHLRLHQLVLKKISPAFFAGLGFFYDFRWNVQQEFESPNVNAYGLDNRSISAGPVATISYDNRTNSINPLKGFYANAQFRPNFTALKSTRNWQSLTVDIRRYFNLPAGSKNTLAFWNYNWITLGGKPPYLDLPATGWDPSNNTGRGYIQGRFRSTNLLYFETEYRFSLTRNGLLGGVVFGNAQSVSDWPNRNFTRISPAAGLGMRIKVNKTSRANIAIDYGFGLNGSRGLFVNLGEVF